MNKAVLLLPLIILSLMAAIWAGWVRIGWDLPVTDLAARHGALMVNSFLASLIFLERAAAFKSKWVLLIPLVNVLSMVAFALKLPILAQLLFLSGSAGFTGLCVYLLYLYRESYYLLFLAGAFCLLTGNLILYKTNFYPNAVTWWMAFLLFTIVAERLELSRFLALSRFKRSLLWLCTAVVLISLFWPFHAGGHILLAAGVALTGLWLLKFDMARHSLKAKGQHRYSGSLLLAGYAWLLIMSVALIVQDRLPFGYDAVLHSFFIGFVFSMIFSHAVIILPAVLRIPVRLYRPSLYGWFVLLQISLMVRMAADVAGDIVCRKIAGMANGATILLFFVSIGWILRKEWAKQKKSDSAPAFSGMAVPV